MNHTARAAVLARMVMSDHVCPYGLKAHDLLRRRGYAVDDRWLTTRTAVDAFKAEHEVATTPQAFVEGRRIGGYEAVYIDKRELRYACVVGAGKVPLGFVSLVENLMMVAMAGWMLWRHV